MHTRAIGAFPLFVEVDEIYNLACPASPVHYEFDPVQTAKTSVHGSINMLGLAKRVKAKILQASTSEVYDDPRVHPQMESYWGHVNPIGLRSCYDEGKRFPMRGAGHRSWRVPPLKPNPPQAPAKISKRLPDRFKRIKSCKNQSLSEIAVANVLAHVRLEEALNDVATVRKFVEFLLSRLEANIRSEAKLVLEELQLGYRPKTQRIGLILPQAHVDLIPVPQTRGGDHAVTSRPRPPGASA